MTVTSGPIVACENAIEHYDKVIENVTQARDRLLREVDSKEAQIRLYLDKQCEWRNAKETLEARL